MSFFDILRNSGSIGLVIWTVILSMWPVGLVLGIATIVRTSVKERRQTSLLMKSLIAVLAIYLLMGMPGTMNGLWIAITGLESKGAAKAQAIALGISNSLYSMSFVCLGSLP